MAPAVNGFIVDRTGQFTPAFLIAGAVSLLGAVGWGVIIGKVEQVDWNEPGSIGSGAMLG